MSWHLQTPDGGSPKLLGQIIGECPSATKGGAAFAFASAMGVRLLAAEPAFQAFLNSHEFTAVIGLDAITDTNALSALKKVSTDFPKFKPKLFFHNKAGSLFHPKTVWLKTASGGVTITGSGNLTTGGLKSNWEALTVEQLSVPEYSKVEASWNSWLTAHSAQLLDIDHPDAAARALANKIRRTKIKRALTLPEEEEGEAVDGAIEEVAEEVLLNPVLIAEVPKSGNRWKQVNFDVQSYQSYFGVTLGSTKTVQFYHVRNDGSLDPVENRQAVAVVSRNYRFEVGAANGLNYPATGHPIVIFEKLSDTVFKYVLLMPGEAAHTLIQKYLDDNFEKGAGKLRIQITAGDLKRAWPNSPLFL